MITTGQLIDLLCEDAKAYLPEAVESIKRNNHMNMCTNETTIDRVVVDAAITDFINFVGARRCVDVGVYTRDLNP